MSNGQFRAKKVYFSQVSNAALRDSKLSLKAKGLYALIQSYITIENFTLYKTTLKKQCQEGEKAFDAAWKELKDKGYLIQYRLQGDKGVFYYEYELLDEAEPLQNNDFIHTPKKEGVDNVVCGKWWSYNNTDLNNTDLNNTKSKEQSRAAAAAEISEINSFFQDCFNEQPNKQIILAIAEYKRSFEIDCIYEAMKRAAIGGKKWTYAVGILNSWKSKKLFTMEAIERGDKPHQAAVASEQLNHKNKFAKAMDNHNFNHAQLDALAADQANKYATGNDAKDGVIDWSKIDLIRGI